MSRKFMAGFPGVCACCDERFPKGTSVTYNAAGELVRVECPYAESDMPTPAERQEARAKMCASCFLVHAGECL